MIREEQFFLELASYDSETFAAARRSETPAPVGSAVGRRSRDRVDYGFLLDAPRGVSTTTTVISCVGGDWDSEWKEN